MDLFNGLLLITTVHLLAAATPGPDFVLVSQQTLSNGKTTGLFCSIGITLGLSIHILYSAFGLATVIASSVEALWAIKILGGSYLIFLGIKGLRTRAYATAITLKKRATRSPIKTIGLGFLCNALNPKAPIYFVALFTVVISPNTSIMHLAIYSGWIMLIQLIWFSFVAFMLSRPRITEKFQRMGHRLDRIAGGAMFLLGIKVLTTRVN